MSPEERVVAALLKTRKYGDLAPELLLWAARYALRRVEGERAAVDLARRKLHQVSGAFLGKAERKRVLHALAIAADAEGAAWRDALEDALGAHASTSERAPDHGALWRAVIARTGPVDSVLDLGCGLHPLTLPWSGLASDVAYQGWDLDGPTCAAVERSLIRFHPGVRMHQGDVRSQPAWPEVDLALLLKLAPTLEQQETGATAAMLRRVRSRFLVVSWPTRSLGSGRRGRPLDYATAARGLLAAIGLEGELSQVGDELVALVDRRG